MGIWLCWGGGTDPQGGDWDVLGTGSTACECWAVGTQNTVPHEDQDAPGIKVSLDQGALGCSWGPGVQRNSGGQGVLGHSWALGSSEVPLGVRVSWGTPADQVPWGVCRDQSAARDSGDQLVLGHS